MSTFITILSRITRRHVTWPLQVTLDVRIQVKESSVHFPFMYSTLLKARVPSGISRSTRRILVMERRWVDDTPRRSNRPLCMTLACGRIHCGPRTMTRRPSICSNGWSIRLDTMVIGQGTQTYRKVRYLTVSLYHHTRLATTG